MVDTYPPVPLIPTSMPQLQFQCFQFTPDRCFLKNLKKLIIYVIAYIKLDVDRLIKSSQIKSIVIPLLSSSEVD